MRAFDQVSRSLHPLHVERPVERVDVARHPWRTDLGLKNAIFIGLGSRGVPGVELRVGMLRRQHTNRSRKGAVERAVQVFRGNGRLQFDGGHLGARVNAGISPSATLRQDALPGNVLNCVRKFTLDRWLLGLNLPAAKVRAVICDG